MAEPTSCCVEPGGYCARVDTMFNMPSVHVLDAAWRDRNSKVGAGLRLTVESHHAETGCASCGVIAVGMAGGCGGCMTFRRSEDPPPGPAGRLRSPRQQAGPAVSDPQRAARRCRQADRPPDRANRSRAPGWRPALRGHRRLALLPAAAVGVHRHQPGRGPPDRQKVLDRSPPARSQRSPGSAGHARLARSFLAYFTTGRASNGGTEAINGIIELHRRIARGFRNPTTTDYG